MKALYILNKPANLDACLAMLQEDDALILIEDAVVLATKQTNLDSLTQRVYLLQEDLIARGLSPTANYQVINYPKFVALTLEFEKSVTVL